MKYFLVLVGIILVVSAAVYIVMINKDKPEQEIEGPITDVPSQPVTPVEPVTSVKLETRAEPTVDKAVVTINGVPIMDSQVSAKLDEAMKKRLSQMPPRNIPPETLKMYRDSMRTQVVSMMVLEFLVDETVKARKIEITDEDVDAEIKNMITLRNSTLDALEADLSKQGRTLSQFKDDLKSGLRQKRLIEVEMEAAGESTEVTEEDARKFYDENKEQFATSPEQVRASHILISTKELDDTGKADAMKKIEGLLKRARAGEDFGELAKQYTEDIPSKDKGGELTFKRTDMVPPFENAAFSLEVGQISDVVTTNYGYHIIKLSEKIPAVYPGFDEMKERILIYMAEIKKREFWPKVHEKLQSEAKIEWSAEEEARRNKPATPPMMRPPARTQPPAETQPPSE